ncbi:MAG: hypothetical protein GY866_00535 [Proteobacteria bacterium]|nr:hypothetical protein [Pseudomonadota bacterium]
MDYEAIRYFVTGEKPDTVSDHEEIMLLLEKRISCCPFPKTVSKGI